MKKYFLALLLTLALTVWCQAQCVAGRCPVPTTPGTTPGVRYRTPIVIQPQLPFIGGIGGMYLMPPTQAAPIVVDPSAPVTVTPYVTPTVPAVPYYQQPPLIIRFGPRYRR